MQLIMGSYGFPIAVRKLVIRGRHSVYRKVSFHFWFYGRSHAYSFGVVPRVHHHNNKILSHL